MTIQSYEQMIFFLFTCKNIFFFSCYPGSLIGEANTGVTQASGDTGGELQDLLRFRRTEGEPGALVVRRSGDLMGVEVLFILLLKLKDFIINKLIKVLSRIRHL